MQIRFKCQFSALTSRCELSLLRSAAQAFQIALQRLHIVKYPAFTQRLLLLRSRLLKRHVRAAHNFQFFAHSVLQDGEHAVLAAGKHPMHRTGDLQALGDIHLRR